MGGRDVLHACRFAVRTILLTPAIGLLTCWLLWRRPARTGLETCWKRYNSLELASTPGPGKWQRQS